LLKKAVRSFVAPRQVGAVIVVSTHPAEDPGLTARVSAWVAAGSVGASRVVVQWMPDAMFDDALNAALQQASTYGVYTHALLARSHEELVQYPDDDPACRSHAQTQTRGGRVQALPAGWDALDILQCTSNAALRTSVDVLVRLGTCVVVGPMIPAPVPRTADRLQVAAWAGVSVMASPVDVPVERLGRCIAAVHRALGAAAPGSPVASYLVVQLVQALMLAGRPEDARGVLASAGQAGAMDPEDAYQAATLLAALDISEGRPMQDVAQLAALANQGLALSPPKYEGVYYLCFDLSKRLGLHHLACLVADAAASDAASPGPSFAFPWMGDPRFAGPMLRTIAGEAAASAGRPDLAVTHFQAAADLCDSPEGGGAAAQDVAAGDVLRKGLPPAASATWLPALSVYDDMLPEDGAPGGSWEDVCAQFADQCEDEAPAWWTRVMARATGIVGPLRLIEPPVLLTAQNMPTDRVHIASEGFGVYVCCGGSRGRPALGAGAGTGVGVGFGVADHQGAAASQPAIETVVTSAWPRGDDMPAPEDLDRLGIPPARVSEFLTAHMADGSRWACDVRVGLRPGRVVVVRARKFFRLQGTIPTLLFCHVAPADVCVAV
jgi:hypothetical protein